jgi:hypothetical protein
MICKKCGGLNTEAAQFCQHCGNRLAAQATPVAQTAAGEQPDPGPRRLLNKDLIIAGALWVAAFVLFFYAIDHLPSPAQISACELRVGLDNSYLCHVPDPLKYIFVLAMASAFFGFKSWSDSRKP